MANVTEKEKILQAMSDDSDYNPTENEEEEEAETIEETSGSEEETEEEEEQPQHKRKKIDTRSSKAVKPKRTGDNKNTKKKVSASPQPSVSGVGEKKKAGAGKEKDGSKEILLSAEQEGKKGKIPFSSLKTDKSFYHSTTHNVVERRVQLNNNNILACGVQNAPGTKDQAPFEFAALSFIRKNKDGSAFEYNLPLSLTPHLIEALQYIMKENKKFFTSSLVNDI